MLFKENVAYQQIYLVSLGLRPEHFEMLLIFMCFYENAPANWG